MNEKLDRTLAFFYVEKCGDFLSDAFFANALKCIQPWLIFHQIWIFDCNLKPCFVTKFLILHHKVLNMNVSIFLKLSTQMIPKLSVILSYDPLGPYLWFIQS